MIVGHRINSYLTLFSFSLVNCVTFVCFLLINDTYFCEVDTSRVSMMLEILWETHSQDMEVMSDVRLVLTTLNSPLLNGLLVWKQPARGLLNIIEISETSIANENVSESWNSLSMLSYSCFH